MARAAALDYRTVTDVLVARDKRDIELPLALFLSFILHFALIIFLSVFHGINWFKARHDKAISLGGGAPSVAMVSLPVAAPTAPVAPAIEIPPPPAPEELKIEEPVIDIPDRAAEVEFRAPEPKVKEKKPTPKPTATPSPKATPRVGKALAEAAPKTRGALALGAGEAGEGGLGGEGPADPGLTFYAQRITSLIGEVWHKPYVTAQRGTILESIIYFAISKDGRVSDLAIERTSGIPNMDQSALRAVMDAGRLPPLPPTYREDELTVSFSFRYTAGE